MDNDELKLFYEHMDVFDVMMVRIEFYAEGAMSGRIPLDIVRKLADPLITHLRKALSNELDETKAKLERLRHMSDTVCELAEIISKDTAKRTEH